MTQRDIDLKTVETAIYAAIEWVKPKGKHESERSDLITKAAVKAYPTSEYATLTLENNKWPFTISEWVVPISNETYRAANLSIDFKDGFTLYICAGDARRGNYGKMLKGEVARWFNEDLNGARSRIVWLPMHQGEGKPDQIIKQVDDVLAQACWCLVNAGHGADDVYGFLTKYALRYGGENGPGRLFSGNYRGHLSPLALRSWLSRVRHSRPTAELTTTSMKTWPMSVPETAQYIGVRVRSLYRAIEKNEVPFEANWDDFKSSSGQIVHQEKRYLFYEKQAEEAKNILAGKAIDKEKRRLLIEAIVEARNPEDEASAKRYRNSARRWVERQEAQGRSLEDMAKQRLGLD